MRYRPKDSISLNMPLRELGFVLMMALRWGNENNIPQQAIEQDKDPVMAMSAYQAHLVQDFALSKMDPDEWVHAIASGSRKPNL